MTGHETTETTIRIHKVRIIRFTDQTSETGLAQHSNSEPQARGCSSRRDPGSQFVRYASSPPSPAPRESFRNLRLPYRPHRRTSEQLILTTEQESWCKGLHILQIEGDKRVGT